MIYIDDARIPYGRMLMCHMVADTSEELLAMAKQLGVDSKHLQNQGTYREHFDVCYSNREKAVLLGAQLVTRNELARLLHNRRPPAQKGCPA